ncbi:ferredoxin [Streptomyces sp. SAI-208]|uniref:ferredoxin n=1 Tax=unclassified Streptomyces TaxID=2593676 RepID=UPI0024748269|nr:MULTISPECIES: ferredoxin [unclassified Streptomyces]MDH6513925.1 ferredoxin [Streptomyces sp. SAI-090]MDH6565182.1 ferredoxin [Streptomyces sp. SAI-117]MDH6604764.1 ferredoxin [Streptomyces sp. SAI-208]MDH6621994.1 ferredoxin [Streptomyces sp. SAI-135]
MKVEVDLNKCQDHGQCVYAAPDMFALDDEGRLSLRSRTTDVYEAEVDEGSAGELYEAAEVCPLQAITVHE